MPSETPHSPRSQYGFIPYIHHGFERGCLWGRDELELSHRETKPTNTPVTTRDLSLKPRPPALLRTCVRSQIPCGIPFTIGTRSITPSAKPQWHCLQLRTVLKVWKLPCRTKHSDGYSGDMSSCLSDHHKWCLKIVVAAFQSVCFTGRSRFHRISREKTG
jgi:hypothetical protein